MSKIKFQQGKYQPRNPHKYKGDLRNIVFRSSYELKLFKYCDMTETVVEWSSEDIIVPYRDPITGNFRRYFVDVYIKHTCRDGIAREKIIEVKPSKYTKAPAQPKKQTKAYLNEVKNYVINQAKWAAAEKYATKRGMQFLLFTETELGIHK